MKIRFAKVNDLKKCKPFDSRLTQSRISSMVKEKEIVIALQGSKIIGYLRLEFIWLKVPYLSWILVDQDQRRQGIAAEIVAFLASSLRKKGHKYILSSYQDNAPDSKRWHTKLGFKKCGKISTINEDNSTEIFCRLKI